MYVLDKHYIDTYIGSDVIITNMISYQQQT